MIYVTGDLHGDLSRFKAKEFRRLKRKDTLIICGDFGFVWDGSDKEKKILKKLGKKKYSILFVEGANDNLTLIEEYPVSDWNGGKSRIISGNLRHLCRGSIFRIEDQSIFVFGGGEGSLKQSMGNITSWQERNLPSKDELSFAVENLKKANYKIDHIITHQSSRKIKKLMTMEDNEASVLDVFLDEVRNNSDYIGWYFGSYHKDKIIPPNEMALFEKIIPLSNQFNLTIMGLNKRT